MPVAVINFAGNFAPMIAQSKAAGLKAGSQFGGQFTRDVNGKLKGSRGQFVKAGSDAGGGFGRGVNDGSKRGWSLFTRSGAKAGKDAGAGASRGFLGSFKGIAAGAAAVGGVTLFKGFVDSASNMQETLSKSNTVFGSSAKGVENWSKTAASSFGQSQQGALDAAGTFGNLFVQLGIGSGEAAKLSKSQVELASDFASFHNTSPEQAVEAMTAAYRGEYDAVQKYVPTINAAAVEQKALEMGLAGSTKELTAQDKALATQTLLTKGAGDALGDFDRTAGGTANTQRRLSAVWADAQARLGQGLLPIVSAVAGFFADNLPAALNFARDAFSTAGRVVGGFVSALSPVVNFIKSNPAPVFAALGAAILTVLVPAFLGWATSAGAAAISMILLNLPLIATVAAVALVVGALVYAYKNFETFRTIADTVFAAVKDAVGGMVDGFRSLAEIAASAFSPILGFIKSNPAPVFAGLAVVFGALAVLIGGPMLISLGAATVALGLKAAAWLAVAAASLLANAPMILLIATIALLVGAAVYAYVNFETFRNVVDTVFAAVKTAIGFAINFVVDLFRNYLIPAAMAVGSFFMGTLLPIVKTVWSGILSAVQTAITFVVDLFRNYLIPAAMAVGSFFTGTLLPIIRTVWSGILSAIQTAWGFIKTVFSAISTVVSTVLIPIFNGLRAGVEVVFRAVHGAVTGAWRIISPVFSAIVGFVRDQLVTVFEAFMGVGKFVFSVITAVIRDAWAIVSPIFSAIVGFIRDRLMTQFNSFKAVAETVFRVVHGAVSAAWRIISPVFSAIVGFLRDRLATQFNSFKGVAETVFRAVHGAVSSAWRIVRPVFDAIVKFVKSTLIPVWDGIARAVSSAFDAIPRTISAALRTAGNVIAGFLRGAAGIADKIGLGNVAGALRGGADSADKWGEGGNYKSSGPREPGNYARGGSLPPFVTNGPRAIVGEGRRRFPEYVIPTDPQYRDRAQGLWQQAGTQLLAAGGVMDRKQVGQLAQRAGFGDTGIPVAVAQAESGLNSNAVNRNSNGSIDRGLWQINSIHGSLSTFDPQRNAAAAYSISSGGSNWRPWVAYKTGAYRKFLAGNDFINLDPNKGGGFGSGVANQAQDATVKALRDLAAGSLEKIWPTLPVPNNMLGMIPGGHNYMRKGIIDWIKGEGQKRSLAETTSADTKGGGAAGARGGGLAGSTTGINSEFLSRFNAYSAAVGGLSISSGFRSFASQQRLYAMYLAGTGNLAAKPGSSNHERGLAIDHSPRASAAMKRTALGFKLHYPVPDEPWHVEPFARGGVLPVSVHARSFDSGGVLAPGWNTVRNDTGRDEPLAPVNTQRGPLVGTVVTQSPEDIDMLVRRMAFSLGGVG